MNVYHFSKLLYCMCTKEKDNDQRMTICMAVLLQVTELNIKHIFLFGSNFLNYCSITGAKGKQLSLSFLCFCVRWSQASLRKAWHVGLMSVTQQLAECFSWGQLSGLHNCQCGLQDKSTLTCPLILNWFIQKLGWFWTALKLNIKHHQRFIWTASCTLITRVPLHSRVLLASHPQEPFHSSANCTPAAFPTMTSPGNKALWKCWMPLMRSWRIKILWLRKC